MDRFYARQRNASGGFSLVELLVVCVILAILSAGLYSFMAGHGTSGKAGERARSPLERGKDPVCIEQIGQVRQSLIMAQSSDENGKFPISLRELKGLPPEFLACPEGHEPYQYDPATGQVHCVHPGHEKF